MTPHIEPLAYVSPYAWIFWAVFLAAYVPEFVVVARSKPAPGEKTDRGSMALIVVASWLAFPAAFAVASWSKFALLADRVVWFSLGIGILIAGSMLRRYCFRTLGRYFTGNVKVHAGHTVKSTPRSEMQAILALEDGRVFRGKGYGAKGECRGEVVFNTSITGYQEIFTDPSYSGTDRCPDQPRNRQLRHQSEDNEATRPYIEGTDRPRVLQGQFQLALAAGGRRILEQFKIPVLADIDTRCLVRHLRDNGVMRGVISTLETTPRSWSPRRDRFLDGRHMDLAKVVSTKTTYRVGDWRALASARWHIVGVKDEPPRFHVVAYDFGIKQTSCVSCAARAAR
jgi:hypothetical protein